MRRRKDSWQSEGEMIHGNKKKKRRYKKEGEKKRKSYAITAKLHKAEQNTSD